MKTMHHPNRSSFLLTLAAGLAISVAAYAPSALAQHSHGAGEQPGHKDDDHAHGEVAKAGSFADAAQRIAADVKAMDAALNSGGAGGSVAGVSDKANAVATLAKTLGALALAKDSGVPREKVRDINLASKELAEAADNLHNIADAGGAGDVAKSKAAFAPVKAAAAKVAALAPAMADGHDHAHGAEAAAVTHSVSVAGEGGKAIEAGKAASMVFTLKDAKGTPVKDLDTVHEKALHLLAVSTDLSWFTHEHPTRRADGAFTIPMTFPAGGEYTLYFDFTPKGSPQQVVPVKVTASGTPKTAVPLKVDAGTPKTIDGFTVALDTEGQINAGGKAHMSFTITKDGNPPQPVTTLRPYLGAMGHLVIISEDGTQFVHAHPHEGGEHGAGAHDAHGGHGTETKKDEHAGHGGAAPKAADAGMGMGGPKVDFEAHFKEPGTYKAWGQFNVGTAAKEQILTVPFTFTVEKGGAGGHGEKHGAAPANTVCPITADAADAKITRDFKGQAVAFHDPASAAAWEKLSETEKMSKFVAAIAASSAKGGHDGDDSMPTGVSADDERALYLTPGGVYTEADIKANGSVTAGDKYKGKMAKHDMKPKAGDKVCPITMTKANPKFTWIIGGKTYEFCCPPCIDEYVLLAKTSPKEVLDPSEYIKK